MDGYEKASLTSMTESGNNLIVSLTGEMDDESISRLAEAMTSKAHKRNLHGAVLDFSAVRVLDAYTYDIYVKASEAMRLLGVRIVWSGLRPSVVVALMDRNLHLEQSGIDTFISLEEGLNHLSARDRV